jgi:hypothetical protein
MVGAGRFTEECKQPSEMPAPLAADDGGTCGSTGGLTGTELEDRWEEVRDLGSHRRMDLPALADRVADVEQPFSGQLRAKCRQIGDPVRRAFGRQQERFGQGERDT